MTDDQLRAIRERAERLPLTHRNWRVRTIGQGRYAAWVVDYGDPEDDSERFDLFEDPPEAVARFVALCETDVPALLEQVARLKGIETAARRWNTTFGQLKAMLAMGIDPARVVAVEEQEWAEFTSALAGDVEKGVGTPYVLRAWQALNEIQKIAHEELPLSPARLAILDWTREGINSITPEVPAAEKGVGDGA